MSKHSVPDKANRRALILVDLQYDFVEGGALAVQGGQDLIPRANRWMPFFDIVVATQDWHPANHQSFASQHEGIAVGDCFDLNGLNQIAWPDHCIQHTHGAELIHELSQQAIDRVVRKGTESTVDSYSGFFDNGHRRSTGLAEYLQSQSIHEVFVMGVATEYCVRFTAIDSVNQGFRTTLIKDGCRGVELESGDIERAIAAMKDAGVAIMESHTLFGKA